MATVIPARAATLSDWQATIDELPGLVWSDCPIPEESANRGTYVLPDSGREIPTFTGTYNVAELTMNRPFDPAHDDDMKLLDFILSYRYQYFNVTAAHAMRKAQTEMGQFKVKLIECVYMNHRVVGDISVGSTDIAKVYLTFKPSRVEYTGANLMQARSINNQNSPNSLANLLTQQGLI